MSPPFIRRNKEDIMKKIAILGIAAMLLIVSVWGHGAAGGGTDKTADAKSTETVFPTSALFSKYDDTNH